MFSVAHEIATVSENQGLVPTQGVCAASCISRRDQLIISFETDLVEKF
jgi:hypothetical protein